MTSSQFARAHRSVTEGPDFYSKQAAEISSAVQTRKFLGRGDIGASESLERISEISRTAWKLRSKYFCRRSGGEMHMNDLSSRSPLRVVVT